MEEVTRSTRNRYRGICTQTLLPSVLPLLPCWATGITPPASLLSLNEGDMDTVGKVRHSYDIRPAFVC